MGSIVGALSAAGMDSEEIDQVVRQIDWDDLFDDDTPRPDQPIRRKSEDRLGFYGPALGIGIAWFISLIRVIWAIIVGRASVTFVLPFSS